MINENLKEFMDKVDIIDKDLSRYEDLDKGVCYFLSTTALLPRVDYLELTKEELEKAKFEQLVDKKDYKMYDCNRVIPKSKVTKDKKDAYTITNAKVKATHIWNVSNGLKVHTTFEDKEEALKLYRDICLEIKKHF